MRSFGYVCVEFSKTFFVAKFIICNLSVNSAEPFNTHASYHQGAGLLLHTCVLLLLFICDLQSVWLFLSFVLCFPCCCRSFGFIPFFGGFVLKIQDSYLLA